MTTAQAAKKIGVKLRRIQQLVEKRELKAVRIGRDWLIDSDDVAAFTRRPVGRPKKKARR